MSKEEGPLNILSSGTADYWVEQQILTLDNPNAIEFLREGVSKYHPVIIKGKFALAFDFYN